MLIAARRVAIAPAGATTTIRDGYVDVRDGVISEVGHGRPPRTPDVALETGVLVPGLVDLQLNGGWGVDLALAEGAGWARVAARLPATGVTSFLAALITAPAADLRASLERAARVVAAPPPGARPVGIHLEGPFIAPGRAGAHPPEHARDPDLALLDDLLDAGGGHVRVVTLAPERPGALEAIRALAGRGVVASVGHSDATAEEVERAADAGARMVTHVFNAQSGIGHRAPGVAAQALVDERLAVGLIADLVHVAPAAVRLAFAAAGDRIVLVSDAVAAAIPGDGSGPPRRADGVLLGSALRLDAAVANVASLGVDLATAIDAATRRPAEVLGRADLGRIAVGARADLVHLGDDLRTAATWIAGERVVPQDRGGARV